MPVKSVLLREQRLGERILDAEWGSARCAAAETWPCFTRNMPSQYASLTNDRMTATQFVVRNRGGTEVRKLNCHHGPGHETSRGRWGKMRQRIMIYRFPIATHISCRDAEFLSPSLRGLSESGCVLTPNR